MIADSKEVRFDLWCRRCKHANLDAWEDPCNECMGIPVREGTEVPECYEEKK